MSGNPFKFQDLLRRHGATASGPVTVGMVHRQLRAGDAARWDRLAQLHKGNIPAGECSKFLDGLDVATYYPGEKVLTITSVGSPAPRRPAKRKPTPALRQHRSEITALGIRLASLEAAVGALKQTSQKLDAEAKSELRGEVSRAAVETARSEIAAIHRRNGHLAL